MADGFGQSGKFRADVSMSNISSIFFGQTYQIPPYQRDYCWQEDHVRTLLGDLIQAFDSSGPANDDGIPDYFLGAIVTQKSDTSEAHKVVDGQQRLTTLMVLMAVLALNGSDNTRKTALELIYRPDDGENGAFVINVHDFNLHLRRLLHNEELPAGFPKRLQITSRIKSSATLAFEKAFRLCKDQVFADLADITLADGERTDDFDRERIDHFFQWLISQVYFAHIYDAEDEQCVFDRMNTRGLHLSDGQKFLSRILANEGEAPRDWRTSREKSLNALNKDCLGNPPVRSGLDAEKRLLAGFLIARKIDLRNVNRRSVREAKNVIANPYNWLLSDGDSKDKSLNHNLIYDFLKKEYFPYSKNTHTLRSYSYHNRHAGGHAGFHHAAIAKIPFLDAAFAAAITASPKSKIKDRLKALGDFLDVLAFYRCWAPTEVRPGTAELTMLKAVSKLTTSHWRDIRRDLFNIVQPLPDIGRLAKPTRTASNARWMRYALARMELHLTRQIVGPKTKVSELPLSTKGTHAHELEHVLSNNVQDWGHIVGNDPAKMEALRQRLGALSILPRRLNRDASNKPFSDRVEIYRTAGWLSKSLLVEFYNGSGTAFVGAHKDCPAYGFRGWNDITIEHVEAREDAMVRLATDIWRTGNILQI